MHTSFLILELTLLTAGVVGLLAVVGLTPVALAVPDLGGAELLLCPFVGLAILYWASQWLSPYFASGPVVVVTCAVSGLASLVVIWRKRELLVARIVRARVDVAILAIFGLAITIVLQLPLLHDGTFTISASGGDDLMAWAPTATFMQSHAYTATQGISTPLLWILPTNIYPGSAGTVDGGLLTIFHMKGFQFVDPFTAMCLALGACAVYGLLRCGLQTTRSIALLGLLFIGVNELRPNVMGLAQAARGTALMLAVVLLFLLAFRRRRPGMAALAGGIAATLVGVYMPAFLLAFAAIVGGTLVLVFPALRGRAGEVPWRTFAAFVAGGLVFGIQNIRWLFFQGGLSAWKGQIHYAHIPVSEPLQLFAGTAPFLNATQLFWNGALNNISFFVALVAIGLVLIGAVGLALQQHFVAGCLIAPLLYGTLVFVAERGGFGAYITVAYVLPILCVLAAYGVRCTLAFSLRQRKRAPTHDRKGFNAVALTAGALGVGIVAVIAFETLATANLYDLQLALQPPLSPANLHLSSIAGEVPKGAAILMYSLDGSTDLSTYEKTMTLADTATFLPDRNVTIDGGTYFNGLFSRSDAATITGSLSYNYAYILEERDSTIAQPKVPSTYHVIWTFPRDHLVLYAKGAPRAATASLPDSRPS